ncbi:hypothetical protein [Campylobacter troglodytis]|uniref:hypothetical protein n=1 Tax=Campylobacter troglodytis TaxID=654363 RepID=UPI001157673F|nr:hypothetical protein [Campylobacter troglodytis]
MWLINTHNGCEFSTCHFNSTKADEEAQTPICHFKPVISIHAFMEKCIEFKCLEFNGCFAHKLK